MGIIPRRKGGRQAVGGTRDDKAQRFEQLAAPLEKQVYHTCFNLMGNREDAEDCAQEAMLRAFRALDTFRGDAQFSTWLYKIAVRVCLDALRKRRQTVSLDLLSESGWEVPDGAPELYEQLEKGERRRLLRDAVGQLPADFKAPQVLVDLQGLSYEEAADVLGLPLGTVKSRVYRARRILLRILSQSGELFLRDGRPKGEGRED